MSDGINDYGGDYEHSTRSKKAAAPLSAPTHIEEPVFPDDYKSKNISRFKAEVASSPSPTRIGQRDEVVNGNLIEIWKDSQTKMYVTKFLEMLASGRTKQDAIESLQAMVLCQARMFAGEMAIIDGTLQEIKPRGEWVKVTPETMPQSRRPVTVAWKHNAEVLVVSREWQFDGDGWIWFDTDGEVSADEYGMTVHYWMYEPLPSPPQENRDE